MTFTQKEIEEQNKLVPLNKLKIPEGLKLMLDAIKAPRDFKKIQHIIEKEEFLQDRLRRWKKSNSC